MTKEQALVKKLEQARWQFPNHVVFKKDNKVYHYDPNNFNEENIFSQTGLRVFKGDDDVALYDPEYFVIDGSYLAYKGTATENIPQPINLREYDLLFSRYGCKTLDLSNWDFSEVVSMRFMFDNSGVKTIILGNANFSKCKGFYMCFSCCDRLKELALGEYKVSSKAAFNDMFFACDKLTKKYGKSEEELADIFKSGQWNSLQSAKKSKLSKKMEAF